MAKNNEFQTVIRAISLPKWLNEKAKEKKINVSKVVQKALMETLQVEEPKK